MAAKVDEYSFTKTTVLGDDRSTLSMAVATAINLVDFITSEQSVHHVVFKVANASSKPKFEAAARISIPVVMVVITDTRSRKLVARGFRNNYWAKSVAYPGINLD